MNGIAGKLYVIWNTQLSGEFFLLFGASSRIKTLLQKALVKHMKIMNDNAKRNQSGAAMEALCAREK